MASSNKEYKNLNCKIDKEISDLFEQFISKTRMSKTATVEQTLKKYIERYNKTERI